MVFSKIYHAHNESGKSTALQQSKLDLLQVELSCLVSESNETTHTHTASVTVCMFEKVKKSKRISKGSYHRKILGVMSTCKLKTNIDIIILKQTREHRIEGE